MGRTMTDNKLTVNTTLQQANQALATAQMAQDKLDQNADVLRDGIARLNARRSQTDRIDNLRNRTLALVKKIQDESNQLDTLSTEFEDHDNQLQELLARVAAAYKEIKRLERFHRICS